MLLLQLWLLLLLLRQKLRVVLLWLNIVAAAACRLLSPQLLQLLRSTEARGNQTAAKQHVAAVLNIRERLRR